MRLREPKSTALVFRTGKLICAGCRSIPAAVQACHLYTRILQRIQYPLASAAQFTVINLVATINLRFPIRLESLAAEHEESCSYEPELFPGLVYRLEDPKCVVLVFVSGKCVVTGAKGMEDVRRAVELIYPLLRLYRKQQTSSSSTAYAAATDQQADGSSSIGG
jgi:transcription initiation factor TFIID TATA-box-binding protein